MPATTDSNIRRAADILTHADALIVTAGAGMGVDSGLPDFRGNEGFWKAYPALGKARINFTSAASPDSFVKDPRLAWGFYGHRIALYRRTVPHRGFALLKHWGSKMTNGLSVFTSNVDGQFQIAGYDPALVNECHGSIHHLQCMTPCSEAIWEANDFLPEVDEAACQLLNDFPRCPHCGDMARPNVLMFGDWSWIPARQEAQAMRQAQWLSSIQNPVVIELGAGTAIPTVRHFSENVCRRVGGRLIRINLRESQVPRKDDIGLPMTGLEGLQAMAEVLGPAWAL